MPTLVPASCRAWLQMLLVTAMSLPACMPANAADIHVSVVDAQGKPLPDAVVAIQPQPGTAIPPARAARPGRSATIEQIDREFVPYVMAVRAGTTVNFPNRDPLMHHVYSFSSVKNFEIKLYSGELPRGIVFDKAGIVTLGCNIHDWMIGYIYIADTPYFAKTDARGSASVTDVPPGDYDLQLWHPEQKASVPAKPLRIDSRTQIEQVLTMDVSARKKKFKPPLNPAQYR